MMPSRFKEEQIIGILHEQEAGAAVLDLCGRHGLISANLYKWKAMYCGLDVLEAHQSIHHISTLDH